MEQAVPAELAAVRPVALVATPVVPRMVALQGVPAAGRVAVALVVDSAAAHPAAPATIVEEVSAVRRAAVRQAVLVAAPVAPRVEGQPGVPAAGRLPATLVADSAAALAAILVKAQAEVLGDLQPVPMVRPALAQVEHREAVVPVKVALADLLVVPTEVLEEELLAVVQPVPAGQPQPAL